MKLKTSIYFLLILCGYVTQAQTINPRLIPEWVVEKFKDLELDKKYELGAFLMPLYLEADFNKDKKKDIATTIVNSTNSKYGILIIFKDSDEFHIVGAGNELGFGGDDFKWADNWKLFKQGTAYETTFLKNGDIDGVREINLDHDAINIREDEGSGGLIYYNGKKFIWIHQGD